MPTLPAGDLTLLQAPDHRSEVFTSFLIPPILWKARLDDGSIVKGETAIDFDAGTGSYFSLIGEIQEIWVGTADGEKDVGRLRIKGISSGDAGVTGTVTVAGHSLPLQDDLYLTFLHHYPLRPRYSYLSDPQTWYMDISVAYTDQHEEPQPVVIAGEHRAGFLDATPEMVINVDASDSYAMASGASISSYALSVASTAGAPTVNFSTVTGLGDITFTLPGFYWAKYTATDSNGKSQDSYRCYIVCERERSSQWYPFVDAETVELTGDWEEGGWTATLDAKDNATLDDIPDHTLVIIWRETYYGDTLKNITYLADQSSTIFAGYVRDDTQEMDFSKGVGIADLVMGTVESKLRLIYSFSASIVAQQGSVDDWFEGPNWMTVGNIAHYLLHWRSTLFEVADVIGLNDNALIRPGFEPDDSNLYDMVNTYTLDEGIRAKLVCDQGGRMHLTYDIQLLTDTERGALATVFDIKKDPDAGDYGGSLTIPRQPENEVPFVTSDGTYWDGTTYDVDGRPEATGDWCVIAPGGVGLEEGPTPKDFPRQAVSSLQHLKEIAGRFLAKTNNPIEEVRFAFAGDYLGVLDIAYADAVWTTSLQAGDTPRGEVWTDKPLYCRNIVARFRGDEGIFVINAAFEAEADGIDGEETSCPGFPLLGGEIPPIPLPDDIPGALMTGSSVHYRSVLGNTWTKRISEDVLDLIVDPFWTNKQGSVSPSDAICFRCGDGYIKRTTDAFISVDVDVTPSNDPPNDAGDSPAPTATDVTYFLMEGSYINQDEFVVLAKWQNASSEWRSWVAYTDDDGTTWSWLALAGGDSEIVTYPHQLIASDNSGEQHANISMFPTCFVAGYGNWINPNSYGHLYLCTVDGALDITVEDTLSVGEVKHGAKVSDTRFMIARKNALGNISYRLYGISGAGGCETMALLDSDSGSMPDSVGSAYPQVVVLTTTTGLFICSDIEIATRGGRCRAYSISGSTIVPGSIIGFNSGTYGVHTPGSCRMDNTNAIVLEFKEEWFGGDGYMYARVLTATPSAGSPYLLDNSAGSKPDKSGNGDIEDNRSHPKITYLRNGVAVACWDCNTGIRVVAMSFSGAVITVGAPYNPGGYDPAVIRLDDNTFQLVSANSTLTCSVDGSLDITYNEDVKAWDTGSLDQVALSALDDSVSPIISNLVFDDGLSVTKTSFFEVTIASGSNDAIALGLSLGKSAGNKAWVTTCDDVILELLEIALPGLTISDRFELGSATITEALFRTLVAYAFVPFGYDDAVYVYGRMDDPQSLGSAQVIRTIDGGSSFGLIEGGWGVDHAGALVLTTANYLYAIRNRGNQAKIYRDNADNILVVKLTLPFTAEVAPHGMLVDFVRGDVYACAWEADAVMVVKVPPPLLVAKDITFDHEVIEGIWSIVGL